MTRKSAGVYLGKQRVAGVPFGKPRIGIAPQDGQLWVAPEHTALVRWVVKFIAFVQEFSHFRTNNKAVGEATRNEQLPPVLSRQHYSDPAAEGLRADSDIHRNVQDLAADNPAQFRLRIPELVVQPTKNARVRYGLVFLDEYRFNPERGELFSMIGLEKATSGVFKDLGLNYEDTRQLGFYALQGGTLLTGD